MRRRRNRHWLLATVALAATAALASGVGGSSTSSTEAHRAVEPEAGYRGPHPATCFASGTNPTECRDNQRAPYDPFRQPSAESSGTPVLRGIRLTATDVRLVENGRTVKTIPVGRSGVWTRFEDIEAAIKDPAWIDQSAPGTFELKAALHQDPDTTLLFSSPEVKTLRLWAHPGVFVRGVRAVGMFDGVNVTSRVPGAGTPDKDVSDGRPFILYERGSYLSISGSHVSYLGSDHVKSYGVAWSSGSKGRADSSTFSRNFFGVHLDGVDGVVLRRNIFAQSAFYGVNVHTNAKHVVIEDNETRDNGAHGLILAEGVTDSRAVNNSSHHNGGNGIVAFDRSTNNRISANRIDANLDGIAAMETANNLIVGNRITRHRIGIRVFGTLSEDNRLVGNTIRDADVGIKVYGGPRATSLDENRLSDIRGIGVILDGEESSIRSGEVHGAAVGLDVRSNAHVARLTIGGAREGVRVNDQTEVTLDEVRLDARSSGVLLHPGARAHLSESTVMAPSPVKGGELATLRGTRLVSRRRPSIAWLPFAGLAFLLLALAFEVVRGVRSRVVRKGTPLRLLPTRQVNGAAYPHAPFRGNSEPASIHRRSGPTPDGTEHPRFGAVRDGRP